MDQLVSAFDGNIDFTNLNQEVVTITTTVDGTGAVITGPGGSAVNNPQFSSDKIARPIGALIIRAVNTTDTTAYTTGAPFIHFSILSDNLFKINKITGLVADNKYSIRILLIGG
jgi:hypothetical protein